MENLTAVRLAFIFSGCFLGAGYVSGQEMWQYFGSYGSLGYCGFAIAMALIFLFGIIVIRLAQITGSEETDRLMIPGSCRFLQIVIAVLELIMMFAVVSVMTAGIGALLEQLFSFPHVIGSLVFAVLILVLALFGLRSIVSAFSVSVPFLVAATVIFGLVSLFHAAPSSASESHTNQLLGSFFGSSVNFSSYNSFMAVAIMAPFGKYVKNRRTTYLGIGLGVAALIFVGLSVMTALSRFPEASLMELPMLFVASSLSPVGAYIYAALLAAAMFGTGLSSFVAAVHYLSEKSELIRRRYKLSCIVFCACTFAASLFGFGDLISVLYPIFGYCSIAFLALMAVNFFLQLRRHRTH